MALEKVNYSDIKKAIISSKKKQNINNANTSTLKFHSERLNDMYYSILKHKIDNK